MIAISGIGGRLARFGSLGAFLTLGASVLGAQGYATSGSRPAPSFTVDGDVALNALVSLSDMHLRKLADMLTALAGTDAARSCDWERVRTPLAATARANIPAVYWFAEPDGGYWTITEGRAKASLADRSYFPRVLSGKSVIGDLVVSHSTGRNTAIVAVPVRAGGSRDSVIGVLGASVHLDSLAGLLREEMGGLRGGLLFFAIDSAGLGALNSDESLIFTEPMKLGDSGMQRAFRQILSTQAGIVMYDFRGSHRTVLYRRSAITGWSFGFGSIGR